MKKNKILSCILAVGLVMELYGCSYDIGEKATENKDIGNKETTMMESMTVEDETETFSVDDNEDAQSLEQRKLEKLNVTVYEYPDEFTMGDDLKIALSELGNMYDAFDISQTTESIYWDQFIQHYILNSGRIVSYVFDEYDKGDKLFSKDEVEYVQYSLTNTWLECTTMADNDKLNLADAHLGLMYGEIVDYEVLESQEDQVHVKATYNRFERGTDVVKEIYDMDVILNKNPYSCLDGYSIETMKKTDRTPVTMGDGKQHFFEGCIVLEDEGVYTIGDILSDEDIYAMYVTVDAKGHDEWKDILLEGQDVAITFTLPETEILPVKSVFPDEITIK